MVLTKLSEAGPLPLTVTGWGAFFFPPIFVGNPLEKEALRGGNGGRKAFVKALDTEYKGRLVTVSREGLVVVAEKVRATAVELLNEIMAILLYRSIPVYSVRETDLVRCSIDPAGREIVEGAFLYSTGAKVLLDKVLLEKGFVGWDSKYYHPNNIRSFIRRAETLTQDPSARMDLMLLLEAYTRYQESAFTPAFLLSWLAVERWLRATWRRTSEGQAAGGETRAAASDAGLTVERVIAGLHLRGGIDPSTYDEVTKLYCRWKAIMYSADKASGSETEAIFHFILSCLRRTTLAPE